jgi:hypothetical protein
LPHVPRSPTSPYTSSTLKLPSKQPRTAKTHSFHTLLFAFLLHSSTFAGISIIMSFFTICVLFAQIPDWCVHNVQDIDSPRVFFFMLYIFIVSFQRFLHLSKSHTRKKNKKQESGLSHTGNIIVKGESKATTVRNLITAPNNCD